MLNLEIFAMKMAGQPNRPDYIDPNITRKHQFY